MVRPSLPEDGELSVDRYLVCLVGEIKRVVWGLERNAHLGIFNSDVPVMCRTAFDIRKVLQHKVWKSNKDRGEWRKWSVDADEPSNFVRANTAVLLPECSFEGEKK